MHVNNLYRSVDYSIWLNAGEPLSPGTGDVGDYTIDNKVYDGSFSSGAGIEVENVEGREYRKVTVIMSYLE